MTRFGRLRSVTRLGIYWLLALLFITAFAAIPDFRTWGNISNVLNQSAPLAVLAVGQTFVITAGLMDLSVGQLAGLVVVLSCAIAEGRSAWALPVVLLAAGLGLGVGAVNGFLVNRLRIHSLILTFGMLSVLQGAIFVYTDRSVGQAPLELVRIANGQLFWLPSSLVLVALLAVAAHLVLRHSPIGLHIAAIGGDEESAHRVGLALGRVRVAAFMLSGLSAGIGGLLIAGRIATGYPNAGTGYELDAIVAVVLGGTSIAGGRGTIIGSVAATLLLGLVSNVLNLMQVSDFLQMAAKGLIVIAAILLNQPGQRTGIVAV